MPDPIENHLVKPEEDPRFFELHREHFIRETLDLRQQLDCAFGEVEVSLIKEVGIIQKMLFDLSLPSRAHIQRITSLPKDHPDRTLFDERLRKSLAHAKEKGNPLLFSIRPGDGLSVSYNAGFGHTEPYLTLLFEDRYYHLTQSTSRCGKLEPTNGLVSIRDENLRYDLILELPLIMHMRKFQHLREDDLRYEMPGIVFPLEQIAAESLKGASNKGEGICIVIKDHYEPDNPNTKEYRFQINSIGEVESLTIVGENSLFAARLTARVQDSDLSS